MAAEYDHLPVYKAAYDLLQHVYRDKCIASVPRDVKYTLVERLKQDILEVLVLIYKAHYNMLATRPAIAAGARADTGRQGPHADHVRLCGISSELFRTLAVEVESVFQTVGRLAHQDFAAQDRRSSGSGSGPDCGCGSDCGFRCGFRCPRTRLAAPAATTRPVPAPAGPHGLLQPRPRWRPPFPAPGDNPPGSRGPACGPCGPWLPLRLCACGPVCGSCPCGNPPGFRAWTCLRLAPAGPVCGPLPLRQSTRPAPCALLGLHGPFAAPARWCGPFPALTSASLGSQRPLGGPWRRQRMMCKHDAKPSLRADRIGVPSRSSASRKSIL